MAQFIELTTNEGKKVVVNVEYITSMKTSINSKGSYIHVAGQERQGYSVKESYEEVKNALAIATSKEIYIIGPSGYEDGLTTA